PEKTLFLLVAENQDKILNTIISRTQLLKINRLDDGEVKEYLQRHHQLNEQQAAQIAFISDGNVQQAIQLLAEDSNGHFDLLIRWLRCCVTDQGASLIKICDEELSKLGRENQKSFLLYAINIMRQALLLKEDARSEEHTSELQSRENIVCRLLLEKK